MSVGRPRTPTECPYDLGQRPEHEARQPMASLQVGPSQSPLPIVCDVFSFTMLGSLYRVNVMTDFVKEHHAEQE